MKGNEIPMCVSHVMQDY